MQQDEQQIRQLIADWMTATQAGEVDKVLSLMADDVVFLVPGQPPMRKADFAALARQQAAAQGMKIEGSSEIQELQVHGDWAFAWARLKVVVTPPDGAAQITRAGHTLSVFQKLQGRWVLARDANLLATVPKTTA